MKMFITGASGYIGGSVAMRMLRDGHDIVGLTRSPENALRLKQAGITPVVGSLDDTDCIVEYAQRSDVVINAANSDHQGAATAIIQALAGSGKRFIHTSGSSIVGTRAAGQLVESVFDEQTPFEPSAFRAARVALNQQILEAAGQNIHTVVIAPSLIYGNGRGLHRNSMQVPWMLNLAAQRGIASHVGPGENRWSNVHIDDLAELYVLALTGAPSGAFYFAENGENSMLEVARAIGTMMGLGEQTHAMTPEEASAAWGEGPANDTMASNSRVRARRARSELQWQPVGPTLLEEIATGCYCGWS